MEPDDDWIGIGFLILVVFFGLLSYRKHLVRKIEDYEVRMEALKIREEYLKSSDSGRKKLVEYYSLEWKGWVEGLEKAEVALYERFVSKKTLGEWIKAKILFSIPGRLWNNFDFSSNGGVVRRFKYAKGEWGTVVLTDRHYIKREIKRLNLIFGGFKSADTMEWMRGRMQIREEKVEE
jgi:hypothetical protein